MVSLIASGSTNDTGRRGNDVSQFLPEGGDEASFSTETVKSGHLVEASGARALAAILTLSHNRNRQKAALQCKGKTGAAAMVFR